MPQITFSQEYEYIPFPDSGAIWSEYYQDGWGAEEYMVYERFALNGEDTVINDLTYKKLYIFHDTTFNKSNASYVGGIREDENKRVYFKGDYEIHSFKPSYQNTHNHDELLLYDFSLSIGDTLKEGNLSYEEDFIILTSIDTILIGNSYRKQYKFNNRMVKWIEGIGNLRGLLFSSGGLKLGGPDGELICFKQNNKILYFNNYYDDCMPFITGIETYQYNNSAIIVYPNPATKDCVTFQFDNCLISDLKIFDCNGSSPGIYKIGEQPDYILKTEKYQPGVYFYIATTKRGLCHTGKFVVQ